MKLFLHHWLDETSPSYGNRHPLELSSASAMSCGHSSNSLLLKMHNHLGTHVDCPYHFDPTGKKLSDYEASDWHFLRVQLLDYPAQASEIITRQKILSLIDQETDLLLLRTGFESRRAEKDYWQCNPGLSEDLGHSLREERPHLRAIGFDFISLTAFSQRELGHRAHRAFLGPGPGTPIRVIEDMHLSHLPGPPVQVLVLPLALAQADGAQVSVWADLDGIK